MNTKSFYVLGGNMKSTKILIVLFAILLLIVGCSQKNNNETQPTTKLTQTALSNGSSDLLTNPDALDTSAFSEIEKVFMKNCYNGLEASPPYIKATLDTMVEKQKPLKYFSALIRNVKKSNDSKCTLTIDRVVLNLKYDAGATGTEPFLINKEVRNESIDVDSGVFITINTAVSVEMDEKLNEYIKKAEDHYFDFYTCDGEVLFILEGVMP